MPISSESQKFLENRKENFPVSSLLFATHSSDSSCINGIIIEPIS
jgi:hypothetical protein